MSDACSFLVSPARKTFGCIMYCFSAAFRKFVRSRDYAYERILQIEKESPAIQEILLSSCVEKARDVSLRMGAVRRCELACIKKCKKCEETSESRTRIRADFSKRAQKQYIMHTWKTLETRRFQERNVGLRYRSVASCAYFFREASAMASSCFAFWKAAARLCPQTIIP